MSIPVFGVEGWTNEPALPPPPATMEGWFTAVRAYAKGKGLPLETPEEVAEISRVERLVRSYDPAFAEFDQKAASEESDWNDAAVRGKAPPLLRSREEIKAARSNMERAMWAAVVTPCQSTRKIFDAIWARIKAAGLLYADVLDKAETEFYLSKGVRNWLPQAGRALREHIRVRDGKPYEWHGGCSPSLPAASLGITLDLTAPTLADVPATPVRAATAQEQATGEPEQGQATA